MTSNILRFGRVMPMITRGQPSMGIISQTTRTYFIFIDLKLVIWKLVSSSVRGNSWRNVLCRFWLGRWWESSQKDFKSLGAHRGEAQSTRLASWIMLNNIIFFHNFITLTMIDTCCVLSTGVSVTLQHRIKCLGSIQTHKETHRYRCDFKFK